MTTIYLGLGSNLGNREKNLHRAITLLSPEITVIKSTIIYDSKPMYVEDQPRFLNTAVEAQTTLTPHEVLQKIKLIEKEMGEHEHNQPRIIDIDLLFYGGEIINTPELAVPHQKIAERWFVLKPMADIAPDFIHPGLGVTIDELLKRL